MPRGISYRSQVLAELAGMIDAVEVDHPVRVAIDGITAAGKTTLADELGKCLAAGHRSVIRLSMDGYHHPRAHRHRQGRDSADGYYEDAYDFDAFAAQVLVPLGQIGSTTGHGYRPAIIDLATDTPLDLPQQPVPGDAVVIVDGSFLARDEVVALWDLRIWVDTSFAVARQRGATRDADQFGGFDRAAHLRFEIPRRQPTLPVGDESGRHGRRGRDERRSRASVAAVALIDSARLRR